MDNSHEMQAEMIEGIVHWIECESPTSSAAGCNRMIDLVVAMARETNVSIDRIPGVAGAGDHLILRYRPDAPGKPILMLSHLDTVHGLGSTRGEMPPHMREDRIFGPGVSDMKGGAYIGLCAFLDVVRSGRVGRPITFVFTSDEETGSSTSRAIIEREAVNAGVALVMEAGRPDGSIVTSRRGVSRFVVEVHGRAAHSGRPEDGGLNAIVEAARQVLAVEALNERFSTTRLTVGLIRGGTAENVVPAYAEFSVDLRFTDVDAGAEATRAVIGLKSTAPDIKLGIRVGPSRPSYRRTEATGSLFEHARQQAQDIGIDLREAPTTGGASDANFTAALGVPTLDGLGIVGGGGHTIGEYGLISSIVPRRLLIRRLLQTL